VTLFRPPPGRLSFANHSGRQGTGRSPDSGPGVRDRGNHAQRVGPQVPPQEPVLQCLVSLTHWGESGKGAIIDMTTSLRWTAILLLALLLPDPSVAQEPSETVIWFDLNDNLARYEESAPPPQGIHLRVVRRPPTEVHVAVLTPMRAGPLQSYVSALVVTPSGGLPIVNFYHFPNTEVASSKTPPRWTLAAVATTTQL